MTVGDQVHPIVHSIVHSIVHVVGVGLSGADSLTPHTLAIVRQAELLVGAPRYLKAFDFLEGVETWPLGDFTRVFEDLQSRFQTNPDTRVVVLASGDPLFFGIGRLLLRAFAADQLMFYPQPSAIQLAFSRLKLPWQDATLVSVHGRDEQPLVAAIKRGEAKIAILTDGVFTPQAIASLITALDFPVRYRLWVCENLGSADEQLSVHWPHELAQRDAHSSARTDFADLNVVVLLRQNMAAAEVDRQLDSLPLIGLPDAVFEGFRDRPTLMTKREIRLLILGALAPVDGQTIWDIGAGTGSVSVELSRLCPKAQLYAIEKTAMGVGLIAQNAEKLAIAPIQVVQGVAPAALVDLPIPDRVFIGGSSGQLTAILNFLTERMCSPADLPSDLPAVPVRRIAIALATLEHLSEATTWLAQPHIATLWHYQLTQINIARSLPVGPLTRFLPLTPITLITISNRPLD